MILAITVDNAAPCIPKAGKPNFPNIKKNFIK